MIASLDTPCICGNTDYSCFWCDKCKRPEDEGVDTTSFRVPFTKTITNEKWLHKIMRIHGIKCKCSDR